MPKHLINFDHTAPQDISSAAKRFSSMEAQITKSGTVETSAIHLSKLELCVQK